ncbi:MAG: hypothetical protein ACI83W_000430 [Marinoscillum sp.]
MKGADAKLAHHDVVVYYYYGFHHLVFSIYNWLKDRQGIVSIKSYFESKPLMKVERDTLDVWNGFVDFWRPTVSEQQDAVDLIDIG